MTLFTVLIIAALIVALLNSTAIDLNLTSNHMSSLKAYYIAEAGIADAIDKISQDTLTVNNWETFFPSGSDKYNVTVTSGSPTIINCTGLAATANFSKILEVTVNVSGSSVPYKVTVRQWKEII